MAATATLAKPSFDLDDIAKRCRDIVVFQNSKFLERTDVNEAVVITLLARQHAILYGPPGSAKTDLIETLCNLITGAKFGSWLLDKQMGKEELFGQYDVAKYDKDGVWERDIEDTVGDCHILFWDEVYRSGPAVLNTLLTLMQNRKVKPGKFWVDAPAVSIFGASNDYPDAELAAFSDRWLVKLDVDYLKEPRSVAALLQSAVKTRGGAGAVAPPTITVDELDFVVNEVIPFIPVPTGIVDTMLKLRGELHNESVKFSDRRLKASVSLVQASAFLNGRKVVDDDDLLILQHVLWEDPTQKDAVQRKVFSLTSEFAQASLKFLDNIAEWEAGISARAGKAATERAQYGGEIQFKIQEVSSELAALIEKANRQGRSTAKLDTVRDAIRNLKVKVLTDCMSLSPDRAAARVAKDD